MASKNCFPLVSTRQRNFIIGEVYHLFQRGTLGGKVFISEAERGVYLDRFFMLCRRHAVRVHNFVLMSTHIHFVVEPETTIGISKMMQELQGPHAREHNRLTNKKGNLWTQHYGCKHVDCPEYYRKLMWYVEHNPVKSGRCKYAENYKWSGAQAHVANGPVTIQSEGKEIKVNLYLDRWREMFLYEEKSKCNWVGYLRSDPMTKEMLKKIESTLDRRTRLMMANMEKMRELQAAKAAAREFKALINRVGPGRALQMMAEIKSVEMRAKQPGGEANGKAQGAG
jgi:REP element-mobilizing transposase RayT